MGDALRLVKRTQLNHASRLVTIRDFGSGCLEVGYSGVQLPVDSRKKEETDLRVLTAKQKEEKRKINLDRSIRRSRAQVRRSCMAGGLDHLLTLTYKDNQTDLRKTYSDLKRFIRLIRKRQDSFKYVAVHEFQKRGAVHFHLAVKGFQDVRTLRTLWLRVVGRGNIDVSAPKVKGSQKWKKSILATYITKYITKDSNTGNSRQRYRVSEGMAIPKKTFIYEFPIGVDFITEIFDTFGETLGFHWKAHDAQHGWACSW